MADPDLLDAAEAASFRARCRAWLCRHATGLGDVEEDDTRGDRALAVARRFQRDLYEAGLAGLTYPRAYGGQGLSAHHERIWREEAARFPLMTEPLSISLGNCLPLLAEFGTAEQKRRHLARAISAEDVWCQLFSEPGAGSDLAMVSTRAVRDDEGWVVDGQKVWTTLAHVSDHGVLLCRTSPELPKHAGLSMFVLDMHAPGVEVRPIHQIDGRMHFNEVFLDGVRLPRSALIGAEDDGWRLATTMLGYQRVARGTGQVGGVRTEQADRLAAEARARGRACEPVLRQGLARLHTAEVCQSVMAQRVRAALVTGRPPGPAGSLAKMGLVRSAALARDLSLELVGPSAVAWPAEGDGGRWARDALWSVSLGIAGGTSEIQRNIVAERVLGLPRG